MSEAPARFQFHSDALADDTFVVVEFEGREEMSTPYSIGIVLLTKKKPESIKFEDLIANKAVLSVKYSVPLRDGSQGTKTMKIQGMLSEFELVDKVHEYVRYRAVLVPRLWKLSLTKQCRVFQDMDVRKLVETVLTDSASHKFVSSDFEFKLHSQYPVREFVVQYNETDLDFIHRWLEHEGIFYYFEQTEKGEKLVLCDAPEAYLSSMGKVRFRPDAEARGAESTVVGEGTWTEETVRTFHCRISRLPAAVKLKDYNYRTPSVSNQADAKVKDSKGEGTVYEYGDHFKTPQEGQALAKVRAEAIKCHEKVFEGTSDVRPFRPGVVFTISDHFHPDFNRDFVITKIVHRMSREISPGGDLVPAVQYQNEFECFLSDEVFRPERKTEWPSVHGFMNAVIDAGGSGNYAEIDAHGRYKVKLPFDLSDKKNGKASRYVRMAQPYAGGGMGMHFPLHKGTEVLLGFIDGDPDRPIISSAIPNPETAGPVSGPNQSQCAIHSGGGNKLVIEDNDGSQQMRLSSPTNNSFISIGAKNPPGHVHIGTDGDSAHDTEGNSFWKTGLKHSEQYLGSKEELVVGSKTEQTVGLKNETITGIWMLQVGALVTEIGWAAKIEKVAGPHLFENPVLKQEAKAFYMLEAPDGLIDIHDLMIDCSHLIVIKSAGSKLAMSPEGVQIKAPKTETESEGAAILKGATIVINAKNEMGVTAGGDLKVEGGTIILQSKGALNQKASEVHVDADTFEVNGSTLEVTKSKMSVKGTTLTVE